MSTFHFAGDVVDCSIPLPLPATAVDRPPPDVTVRVDVVDDLPDLAIGHMLQHGVMSAMTWSFGTGVATETGADPGWVFRFGEAATGVISPDRSTIHMTILTGVPEEWAAEAIVAWALVYRLAVGGRTTFHGSAVTLDGTSAIAILGPSNGGKSTLAAASLALGAAMIADDVLAPRRHGGAYLLDVTGTAVKLRGSAQQLAEHVGRNVSATFDNRLSVDATTASGPARLDRLYFLDPGGVDGVTRIDPIDAAVRLCANAKVGFWTSSRELGDDFEAACELADGVPGFTIGRSAGPSSPSPDTLLTIARSLFS